MSVGLANVIKSRSRTYVVERREAVTVNPETGGGLGGDVVLGSLRCHIQSYDGPRRTDSTAGVSTGGLIKVWVPSDVFVLIEDEDPSAHRWLFIERTHWVEDGTHRQYLARDEGVVS
jgi:hypothetical protein